MFYLPITQTTDYWRFPTVRSSKNYNHIIRLCIWLDLNIAFPKDLYFTILLCFDEYSIRIDNFLIFVVDFYFPLVLYLIIVFLIWIIKIFFGCKYFFEDFCDLSVLILRKILRLLLLSIIKWGFTTGMILLKTSCNRIVIIKLIYKYFLPILWNKPLTKDKEQKHKLY